MTVTLKLKILTGRHSGREVEVRRSQFVIGRADDCDLRPASHEVSRRHCALLVEADRVRLQDLGGSNGTFVNGVRCEGTRDLESGDQIRVGPLEFQVILTVASPSPVARSSEAKPAAPEGPKSAGSATTQIDGALPSAGDEAEDDVMQWLTDAPGKSRPIFMKLEPESPDASATDTGQISLDATHPLAWPESPQTSAPLPDSAPHSALLNSGNSKSKLPDPKSAGNTRDAATAAINMFRHRNDKQPPAPG